jgi:pimeloyl-ACP methyl ester carboxylesterase
VASAAADASAVADALGIGRFAVMGHSGGGSHALACAALLPERVLGVVVVAGMAPFGAEGLDWFEGFGPAGVAQLRAAAAGRAALQKHLAQSDDEPEFTPEDEAALAGEWSWFIDVVRPALAGGMGGFIDDDLASVGAWGFDPADVIAPALFLHGGRDRVVPAAHGEGEPGTTACPTAFKEHLHVAGAPSPGSRGAWIRPQPLAPSGPVSALIRVLVLCVTSSKRPQASTGHIEASGSLS